MTERQSRSKTSDPERRPDAPANAQAQAERESSAALPSQVTAQPESLPNQASLQLRRASIQRSQRNLGNAQVARMLAQRQEAAPDLAAAPAASLIADDAAPEVQPGQMKKSAFLAQLRAAIDATVEAELGGTPLLGQARAEVGQRFAQYSALDGPALERTIKREVPAAAGVAERRLQPRPNSAAEQRAALPPGAEAVGGVLSGIASAASSLVSGAGQLISGIGNLLFKARDGGARAADDPRAVQAQLGAGHALDSRVRSGLESAFGQSLSGVRVHTDSRASALSDQMNARAFTVGQDIAFASGEYQPGTPIGDALIAHEVAHVAQRSS